MLLLSILTDVLGPAMFRIEVWLLLFAMITARFTFVSAPAFWLYPANVFPFNSTLTLTGPVLLPKLTVSVLTAPGLPPINNVLATIGPAPAVVTFNVALSPPALAAALPPTT